jgi:hypothetical protein
LLQNRLVFLIPLAPFFQKGGILGMPLAFL